MQSVYGLTSCLKNNNLVWPDDIQISPCLSLSIILQYAMNPSQLLLLRKYWFLLFHDLANFSQLCCCFLLSPHTQRYANSTVSHNDADQASPNFELFMILCSDLYKNLL